jgi:hypothetical protein
MRASVVQKKGGKSSFAIRKRGYLTRAVSVSHYIYPGLLHLFGVFSSPPISLSLIFSPLLLFYTVLFSRLTISASSDGAVCLSLRRSTYLFALDRVAGLSFNSSHL